MLSYGRTVLLSSILLAVVQVLTHPSPSDALSSDRQAILDTIDNFYRGDPHGQRRVQESLDASEGSVSLR